MDTVERIKELCRSNGITVQNLERQLGLCNGSVVKSSSNMKAEKLYDFANFFNVSMEYLMCKTDDPTRCAVSSCDIALSELEKSLIIEFRKSEHRDAILALLNIKEKNIQSKAI